MARQARFAGIRRTALGGLLAMAALALFGCGQVVKSQVEQGMRRDLQHLIGPAQDYEVNIQGLHATSGTADGATVTGTRVQLPNAPVIDRMDLHLKDIRYDIARRELQSVAHASGEAHVRPADLATFLDRDRHLQGVSLDLAAPNEVTIRGRPEGLGLDLPAGITLSVTGRVVGQGQTVRFEVQRVGAGGLSIGGPVADALSRAINPVVDLSGMPIGVDVTGVRAENGALVLSATGSYPKAAH